METLHDLINKYKEYIQMMKKTNPNSNGNLFIVIMKNIL